MAVVICRHCCNKGYCRLDPGFHNFNIAVLISINKSDDPHLSSEQTTSDGHGVFEDPGLDGFVFGGVRAPFRIAEVLIQGIDILTFKLKKLYKSRGSSVYCRS